MEGSGEIMGRLWELIEEHRNSQDYPPSVRQIALKLDVSPTTVNNWKSPKDLPSRKNLEALAVLLNRPYLEILAIALADTQYLNDETVSSIDPSDRIRLQIAALNAEP